MAEVTYQQKALYDEHWSEEIDNHFIEVLAMLQRDGRFRFGEKNYYAIGVAIDSMFDNFGASFSYTECQKHIAKLFKRYSCFKWMLGLDGVVYDPVTNYVNAHADIWEFMFKKNDLVWAYRIKGDPNWNDLVTMFGMTTEVVDLLPDSSKKTRDTLWDYVVLDSDESGDTALRSTANNSSSSRRPKAYLIREAPPTVEVQEPSYSGTSSSVASNDPFGY